MMTRATENSDGALAVADARRTRGLASVAQGQWGENATVEFLKEKGWEILERNARPVAKDARNELDVVAMTPDDVLVFVEVKTHKRRSDLAPRLAGVDRRKKQNLLRACSSWMLRRHWHGSFRFDVVEVYGDAERVVPDEIDHVENVPLFPPKWRFW